MDSLERMRIQEEELRLEKEYEYRETNMASVLPFF